MVPKGLQRAVWRARRAFRSAPEAEQAAWEYVIHAYAAARQEAVDAVYKAEAGYP